MKEEGKTLVCARCVSTRGFLGPEAWVLILPVISSPCTILSRSIL